MVKEHRSWPTLAPLLSGTPCKRQRMNSAQRLSLVVDVICRSESKQIVGRCLGVPDRFHGLDHLFSIRDATGLGFKIPLDRSADYALLKYLLLFELAVRSRVSLIILPTLKREAFSSILCNGHLFYWPSRKYGLCLRLTIASPPKSRPGRNRPGNSAVRSFRT